MVKNIVIKENTKEMLDGMKLCPTETYDHLINRVLKINENGWNKRPVDDLDYWIFGWVKNRTGGGVPGLK